MSTTRYPRRPSSASADDFPVPDIPVTKILDTGQRYRASSTAKEEAGAVDVGLGVVGGLIESNGRKGGRDITDGLEPALAKARELAGDKRIGLMGANIDQQYLAAGLVDEIRIHLIDGVMHMDYRVRK